MDRAVLPVCHEELRTGGCEINVDERGDVKLSGWISDELEKPVPRVLKVAEPFWSRQHSGLRLGIFYCLCNDLCFDGSKHLFHHRSRWARGGGCRVKMIRWRG